MQTDDYDDDLVQADPEPSQGDAWAEPVSVQHELSRAELELLTLDFLARGGVITQVEPGVSGFGKQLFNFHINRDSPFSIEEQQRYRDKRINRRVASENAAVAVLRQQLPQQPTRAELRGALNCSDAKLSRLLREHFGRDPQAQPYLPRAYRPRKKVNHDNAQ